MTLEQPRLHAVCGHLEIDEMTRCYVDSGQVTQDLNELELDEHQALLLTMKWPGYKFYRGGWGDELLLVPKNPESYLGTPMGICLHHCGTQNEYSLLDQRQCV